MTDEQEADASVPEPVESMDVPMSQGISTEDAITNVDQACAAFGGNRQQHIFLQMSVTHLAERARRADELDAAAQQPPPNREARRAKPQPKKVLPRKRRR